MKIYASRVDSIHSETFKVLGGLSWGGGGGSPEEGDAEEGDGEAGGGEGEGGGAAKEGGAKPKAGAPRRAAPSLEAAEAHTTSLDDGDESAHIGVDPLFAATSAAFDAGGAAGLLLASLSVAAGCDVVFDADEAPDYGGLTARGGGSRFAGARLDASCLAAAAAAAADGLARIRASGAPFRITPGIDDVWAMAPEARAKAAAAAAAAAAATAAAADAADAAEAAALRSPVVDAADALTRSWDAAGGGCGGDGGATSAQQQSAGDSSSWGDPAPSADATDAAAAFAEDDYGAGGGGWGMDNDDDGDGGDDDGGGGGGGSGGGGPSRSGWDDEQLPQWAGEVAAAAGGGGGGGGVLRKKAWMGASHWRFAAPRPPPPAAGGGAPETGVAPKAGGRGLKGAPFAFDFNALPPRCDGAPFAPARSAAAIRLAGAPKAADTLLPGDLRYSAHQLATFFAKPNAGPNHAARAERSGNHSDARRFGGGGDGGGGGYGMDDDDDGGDGGGDGGGAFGADADWDAHGASPAGEGASPEGAAPQVVQGYSVVCAPPPRMVASVGVTYARSASVVDVRALKAALWGALLRASASQNSAEQGPEHAGVDFAPLVAAAVASHPPAARGALSVHMCFIALLHLANEHGLAITGAPGLDTMRIFVPQNAAASTPGGAASP